MFDRGTVLQERGHKVELARVAMKRALTKAAGTPVSADMLHASEIAPPEKVMVTSDEDDRHVYW